jgi:hypothetical protein
VGESVKLIPHSGRDYGPGTSWLRHDHARRPNCDTAIEGSAQGTSGAVWGAYAEKIAVKAAIVAKKPAALSHVDAAALALTARRHLERIAELFQIGAVRAPEIKLYRLSEAADAQKSWCGRLYNSQCPLVTSLSQTPISQQNP